MKGKWQAACAGTYLGEFVAEIDAAKAYDRFTLQKFGEHAKTNELLTQKEITQALQATEIHKSSKLRNNHGKGIWKERGKFRVKIDKLNLGLFEHLEEAQKIAEQYRLHKTKKYVEEVNKLPIQYDESNVAIVPYTSTNKNIINYTKVDETLWHDIMLTKWYLNSCGYVAGKRNGKMIMLHQYVYKKLNGEVPKNHVIDHWGKNEDDPIKKNLTIARKI